MSDLLYVGLIVCRTCDHGRRVGVIVCRTYCLSDLVAVVWCYLIECSLVTVVPSLFIYMSHGDSGAISSYVVW